MSLRSWRATVLALPALTVACVSIADEPPRTGVHPLPGGETVRWCLAGSDQLELIEACAEMCRRGEADVLVIQHSLLGVPIYRAADCRDVKQEKEM